MPKIRSKTPELVVECSLLEFNICIQSDCHLQQLQQNQDIQ
jgi:hypothetical protein